MMADVMAALLALTLAMGAVGGVVQIAVRTQITHRHIAERLDLSRRLDRLMLDVADLRTPPAGLAARRVVSQRIDFDCGGVCSLIIVEQDGKTWAELRRAAGVPIRAEAPTGAMWQASLSPGAPGGPERIGGALVLLAPAGGWRPAAVVRLTQDAPLDCAYDPGSYACRPRSIAP